MYTRIIVESVDHLEDGTPIMLRKSFTYEEVQLSKFNLLANVKNVIEHDLLEFKRNNCPSGKYNRRGGFQCLISERDHKNKEQL